MIEQLSLFEEFVEEKSDFANWILIDGNNLLNRAYYSTNYKQMTAPDGTPTNAITQFLKMALGYQKQFEGTLVVFFDKGKGFRKKLYPEYKEGRSETPESLKQQFPLIREVLSAANIPYFWNEELEADDLISSACNILQGQKYVISNDRDLLQIIREDITIVVREKKEDVLYTPQLFKEKWNGLEPVQVTDIKALAGDNSDNIPGIEGIGDKGAFAIISHFGSVEDISLPFPKELKRYEKKFGEGAMEKAVFFKKLTTLKSSTPLQINKYEINKNGLIAVCEKLAIKSVINLINKA